MNYTEDLKPFFDKWLKENKEPYPLVYDGFFITDNVFTTIKTNIQRIESTPRNKLKRSAIARASRQNLIRIFEALKINNQDVENAKRKGFKGLNKK